MNCNGDRPIPSPSNGVMRPLFLPAVATEIPPLFPNRASSLRERCLFGGVPVMSVTRPSTRSLRSASISSSGRREYARSLMATTACNGLSYRCGVGGAGHRSQGLPPGSRFAQEKGPSKCLAEGGHGELADNLRACHALSSVAGMSVRLPYLMTLISPRFTSS